MSAPMGDVQRENRETNRGAQSMSAPMGDVQPKSMSVQLCICGRRKILPGLRS